MNGINRSNNNSSSRSPGSKGFAAAGKQKQPMEGRDPATSGSATALPTARKGRVNAVPGDDPWHETSVVRTLWPPQPGTLRWRSDFGDVLVCVRYRHDARSLHRYTTVEILVDHAPVRALRSGRKAWQLKTISPPPDKQRRRALRQAGAEWDPKIQAWRLSLTMARQLGLTGQIERVPTSATKVKTKARTKEAKAVRS